MKYDEIMYNLNEIIGTNKDCINVYNTFKVAESIINNKEVLFKINTKMTKLLCGSSFGMEKNSNQIYIFFGPKYLNTYSRDSSLHHTILIHELKHLYDCFNTNRTFFKSNEKEKYFYEFEARKIEAEFIKYYLDGKFKLTKLEKLILNSYNNDDLNNFIILFQRVDKNIYQNFKEFEDDFRENKISLDELMREIINGGYQVIERFLSNRREDAIFSNYVSIKSFRNCLEDLVLEKDNKHLIFNDIFEKYQYLKDLYDKLYSIIDGYFDTYNNYCIHLDHQLEDHYMQIDD